MKSKQLLPLFLLFGLTATLLANIPSRIFFVDSDLTLLAEAIKKVNETKEEKNETEASTDTVPLPKSDRTGDYLRDTIENPYYLPDPQAIEKDVEYDPATNRYNITEKIGDEYYRTPTYMTFDEYVKYKAKRQEQEYFDKLSGAKKRINYNDPISKIDFSNSANPTVKSLLDGDLTKRLDPDNIKSKIGEKLLNTLFGGTNVDIRPQGTVDLTIGGDYHRFDNPILPTRARTNGGLIFDMNIQLNVTGKIGEKLNLNAAFNNKATFDFDRIIKINYNTTQTGGEDAIVKSIEAGNVNLPLKGTLIQGSQNLFGLKTQLQFGKLTVTALAAQQQSRRSNINLQGGGQVTQFAVQADQYDENRHFFLTHFNRNTFEFALSEMPQIKSLFQIKDIEVWVSNDRNDDREVRQIIALPDLGEPEKIATPEIRSTPQQYAIDGKPLPMNAANDLYPRLTADPNIRRLGEVVQTLESSRFNLVQGKDFIKKAAKRLNPNEYTFNPQLGTISLNNIDRQQVLGVSFTYYYNGKGPFQVGDISTKVEPFFSDGDSTSKVLFVKMLKNTQQIPSQPMWDLMMKNVYSLNVAGISNPQDFRLDIYYQDVSEERAEKRFLPEDKLRGQPLLRLFNLDRLNSMGDPLPDGQFDFVQGVTINPRNGRVMFPVLEPFGESLVKRVSEFYDNKDEGAAIAEKYRYQILYDSIVFRAQERAELNRFVIRGTAKSSVSSDISLGTIGLRQGSVRVQAGGRPLTEGVDYEINYGIGSLKILNPAYLSPDLPLSVSFEDNALFGFQTRTMLGLRADYKVDKNFNIGATYLNLFELPYTNKVNAGDDPINNKIYGLDVNFTKDAPWLTKALDKLPLYSTKVPSKINFTAEGAFLKPGHASAIGDAVNNGEGASVYLDDFEGATAPFSLMAQPNTWFMASVPQNNLLFPEGKDTTLAQGANRGLLNWYLIDNILRDRAGDKNSPYAAFIQQQEVFPNRPFDQFNPLGAVLRTFDLSFYPRERGAYNFDLPSGTPFSKGISRSGELKEPQTRWAGIQRGITTTDFETSNIEYVDLWVLNPFIENPTNNGMLYLHLGEVSEDILRDGRKSYENGLPTPRNSSIRTDNTRWGKVPRTEVNIPNAFSGEQEERATQDVGLDGLNDDEEKERFSSYLQTVTSTYPNLAASLNADPSNDNFTNYNDPKVFIDTTHIRQRYKRFNFQQGNSAAVNTADIQSSTNTPDSEDVNRDNSFDENEAYYQYAIPIRSNGQGGLADNPYTIENITNNGRTWYHLRVPIDAYEKKIGNIEGFRNMRYMRLVMKDFEDSVTLRFARMDLIRNQWRRYKREQNLPGFDLGRDDGNATLELNPVNVEDNATRSPISYVLPPGVARQTIPGSFAANVQQNEQALSLRINNLDYGKAKSAFKLINADMRVYKRLKMFVHAEELSENIPQGKTSVFMRIGSDFERNYYEYEVPLTMSDRAIGPLAPRIEPSAAYREAVWLASNSMDINLAMLRDMKQERNDKNFSLDSLYQIIDPENPTNKVKVRGNPNLGQVKGFMVGIYNYDEIPHNMDVWVNEMRMNGLDERAGGAAIARMDIQMADLGTATLSGAYTGIGYGGLEQKVQQRSREEIIQYDVATNLELGKFLPEKSGIKVPFYVQHSNSTRTPQFDPYDLDIELKTKLKSTSEAAKKDSIKANAQTVTTITSYSFNNVRKDRMNPEKKPQAWDIENFSASYAYTQTDKQDPIIASDKKEAYRGGLDYNFSREVKYVTPFKKLIKKDKYLKLLSEFNFNPLPNSVGISNLLDRQIATTVYRFAGEDPQFNTYFNKRFTWDRNYNVQWDLTKSLKVNFDARNNAIIDELEQFDALGKERSRQELRAKIDSSLRQFGRNKRYDQNSSVTYTLPFKNIPFLDWVTVKANYATTYGWDAAALRQEYLGNSIRNTQNRQINGDFNFDNLYNYVGYLRKINTPMKPRDKKAKGAKNDKGTPANPNGLAGAAASQDSVKGKKVKGPYEPSLAERILIRPLMTIRKGRVNYQENFASFVPGYLPNYNYFGMQNFSSPGAAYVFGWQTADNEFLDNAARQGWISSDIQQNRQMFNNYTRTADARLTLEPFTDFRVEIEANQSYTRNNTQQFRDTLDDGIARLVGVSPNQIGSFTTSFLAVNTLFKNDSTLFQTFDQNRRTMSTLLAGGDTATNHQQYAGYKQGYGPNNKDVILPAFIAAYSGKEVGQVQRNIFKTLPNLNWRLTYNGLTKFGIFKEKFQSISITHGYKSTLTINQYQSEPYYDANNRTKPVLESRFDYYSAFDIPVVVISEQFSPLIGIDARLKNDMSLGFNIRKSRNLSLSLSDTRLAQTRVDEYTFNFAYRMKNVVIPFLMVGDKPEKKPKKTKKQEKEEKNNPNANPNEPKGKAKKGNDLELKFDFSLRDDRTDNLQLGQGSEFPARGSRTLRFSPSARYSLNKRLDGRLFFDFDKLIPYTTASFPNTNARGGVVITFKLN